MAKVRSQLGIPSNEVIEPFDSDLEQDKCQVLSRENLLPCPFCGSRKLTLDNLIDEDDWFVSCDDCEVQQIANYTKDQAVARWNRREAL